MKLVQKNSTETKNYPVQLEADLKIAERVHRSMIPSNQRRGNLEIVCDFTPMIEVGGDYASVHFQDDRHVVAAICDVSGHGIAPALLATRVNSFVLNNAPSVHHPCEIVEALNKFIHRNFSDTGLYLTFFCLFIDLEKRVLVHSGCGHPPALLYSKSKNSIIRLKSENPAIGLFEDLSRACTMVQIPFDPGDRVILYTDGITDSENANGTMLEVNGLEEYLQEAAHLQPKECVKSIVCRVKEFREGLPAGDDQLLLAISHVENQPTHHSTTGNKKGQNHSSLDGNVLSSGPQSDEIETPRGKRASICFLP